ncbi:MAG: hypothetical protein ACLR23_01425 [Clostridia bacterium]
MPLRPLHPGDVIEIRTKKPPYPSYQLRPENVSEVGACCIPLKAGVEKDQQVFRLTDAQLLHALREKNVAAPRSIHESSSQKGHSHGVNGDAETTHHNCMGSGSSEG